MRRILLVNIVSPALLFATLFYLNSYQTGLLAAEVANLREQARAYAGALDERAVKEIQTDNPTIVPELARPMLRRLTQPSPYVEAKLFGADGSVVADSTVQEGGSGVVTSETLPAAAAPGLTPKIVDAIYDLMLRLLGSSSQVAAGAGADWQPDVGQALATFGADPNADTDPYIRRSPDQQLLVSVTEPLIHNNHLLGVVLVTREATEVDTAVRQERMRLLGLFVLALLLTVTLSAYLSRTIARPILRLASAALAMREGKGRRLDDLGTDLLDQHDEMGQLANALHASSTALWSRMDAIDRFAADVAHEIKNPLSSIRSAIETLRRIEDPTQQKRLLAIITDDVKRLDRLITDISDASRVDAELSRVRLDPVDCAVMMHTLGEIYDATRDEDEDPVIVVQSPVGGLMVLGEERRLVQVIRNLIGNAKSFSPPHGAITLGARETGNVIELTVEDDGPGIPEANLEHIFDRFYSERPAGEQFGTHSGLGLSISRQIVEALRGRISAENRRDADGNLLGARFVVRLPKLEGA
jgi:two-component system sensor histidine kinase ChvG